MLVGQVNGVDRVNINGNEPVSGFGQCVNFVIPSSAVVVDTVDGVVQDNERLETEGAALAVILIWKELTVTPSVKVNVAVPELLNVTAKGVLMDELEMVAPVKAHKTVVVDVMFVLF
jgi:hypothetical protein